MNYLARLFRKMWILIRREKVRGDLAEEMAFHREHAEREFQTDGMPSEAARHAARREFGNATGNQFGFVTPNPISLLLSEASLAFVCSAGARAADSDDAHFCS